MRDSATLSNLFPRKQKRDAVFLNRLVKGNMDPIAMKDLQKGCLFYQNGTNVYKRLWGNGP